MASESARQLEEQLEAASVAYMPERRCYKTRRGVPDAVVWVKPDLPSLDWCVPLLFELEGIGGYQRASDDVTKFAARYDDNKHRYHLGWPTRRSSDYEPFSLPITYDVRSAASSTVTGEFETSEEAFYKGVKSWIEFAHDNFDTSAQTSQYGQTEVVWWNVSFETFEKHRYDFSVPFITDSGPQLAETANTYWEITVPVVAVIDGQPSAQRSSITAATTVELFELPRYLLQSHGGGIA